MGLGADVDVNRSVDVIVSAYQDGQSILERIKTERATRNIPPPCPVLEETIERALADIGKGRKKVVSKVGKQYEDSDYLAVISLQQNAIRLQSSLLRILLDVIYEGETVVDFAEVVEVAESCKDAVVGILEDLEKEKALSKADTPVDDGFGRKRSRPSARGQPVLHSSQESSPVRELAPIHTRTWTREYSPSADEDGGTGAEEQAQARRVRHGSLLGFLKHHRTHSWSKDAARRVSEEPTSAPLKSPRLVRTESYNSQDGDKNEPKFTYQEGDDYFAQTRAASRSGASRRDTLDVPTNGTAPLLSSTPSRLALQTIKSARQQGAASTSVPNPTPDNNYLGFCKGAWQLQTGDHRGMRKCKEFNDGWSHSTVYYLACSHSKCAFAGHINLDVIWTKVWKMREDKGVKFRWSFLAKSHVTQSRVKDHQYVYQCAFCIYLGIEAPVMHGTDLYLDHIAQEHRGRVLGDVILHKTECVNDRICDDGESFDINIYPLTLEEEKALRERRRSDVLSDELLVDARRDLDAHLRDDVYANEPWNEGLSDFHIGGELELTERGLS